jgi:positive regulator of sigma E activity
METARVCSVFPDGSAEVIRTQEAGCGGNCHQCGGGCSAGKTMPLRVDNPIGAVVGDLVTIQARPGAIAKAVVALYILPLVLFIGGFLLGEHLWQRGMLVSLAGLVLGMILVKLVDKSMAKKGNVYTITGFAHNANA